MDGVAGHELRKTCYADADSVPATLVAVATGVTVPEPLFRIRGFHSSQLLGLGLCVPSCPP